MNKKIFFSLLTLINITHVMAQAIDHTFNYQGELLISGMPANGGYDIKFEGFDALNVSKTNISEHLNVQVSNGLFTIQSVDLGSANFDAFTTFLQVSVRENATGGAYTDLSPRQTLKSVPYASKVIDGNATNGQVYTYNTTGGWGAADPVDLSPWTKNGVRIEHLEDVAIGTNATDATHKLTVKADVADNDRALRLIGTQQNALGVGAKLNFGDSGFVQLEEDTDDHLKISARLGVELASNTHQPLATNGQMKFMLHANCSGPLSSIIKQYNGIDGSSGGSGGSASISTGFFTSSCIITFPFDISSRFYQYSVVNEAGGITLNCGLSLGVELRCILNFDSEIMVLVY